MSKPAPATPTNHELHILTMRSPRAPAQPDAFMTVPEVREITLSALMIEGHAADAIGTAHMQAIADAEGLPLLVSGKTDFHGTKVFHPRQHILSMERRLGIEAA